MLIIPKLTLFFSGWWIELACVGIYWELLGQGSWQSCDFVPSRVTWRVEARVQVRLGFDNIQYFPLITLSCPLTHKATCGMLARGEFFVCVTAVQQVSILSLNEGNPCLWDVESVMLEVFKFCLLNLLYSEDLVSEKTSAAGCISSSFIYVSASENANTIIKLFRKHVINIYLLYFFLLNFCISQCMDLSHMLTAEFFFFPLSALTYVLSSFWMSQVPAVCVTTGNCWIWFRNSI